MNFYFPDYFKSELMETKLSILFRPSSIAFPDYFKSELMETVTSPEVWVFPKTSFPDYFKSELMETLAGTQVQIQS